MSNGGWTMEHSLGCLVVVVVMALVAGLLGIVVWIWKAALS